jgi:hypothetical protein
MLELLEKIVANVLSPRLSAIEAKDHVPLVTGCLRVLVARVFERCEGP